MADTPVIAINDHSTKTLYNHLHGGRVDSLNVPVAVPDKEPQGVPLPPDRPFIPPSGSPHIPSAEPVKVWARHENGAAILPDPQPKPVTSEDLARAVLAFSRRLSVSSGE